MRRDGARGVPGTRGLARSQPPRASAVATHREKHVRARRVGGIIVTFYSRVESNKDWAACLRVVGFLDERDFVGHHLLRSLLSPCCETCQSLACCCGDAGGAALLLAQLVVVAELLFVLLLVLLVLLEVRPFLHLSKEAWCHAAPWQLVSPPERG